VEQARSGCPINAAIEAFGGQLEPARAAGRDVRASALFQGAPRRLRGANRLQHPGGPAQTAGELRAPDPQGREARTTGGLQPDRGVHPARTCPCAAWRVGSAPPAPTTKRLRVRAELLAAGGPPLWTEFMAELRAIHLGAPASERTGPSVIERLAEAYAAAPRSHAGAPATRRPSPGPRGTPAQPG
jgi:hypothetical protein